MAAKKKVAPKKKGTRAASTLKTNAVQRKPRTPKIDPMQQEILNVLNLILDALRSMSGISQSIQSDQIPHDQVPTLHNQISAPPAAAEKPKRKTKKQKEAEAAEAAAAAAAATPNGQVYIVPANTPYNPPSNGMMPQPNQSTGPDPYAMPYYPPAQNPPMGLDQLTALVGTLARNMGPRAYELGAILKNDYGTISMADKDNLPPEKYQEFYQKCLAAANRQV
jgi:hypothetical protein